MIEMESYRNVLANRFMKDTNYIIIKDTDDLEELERQWELFNYHLTNHQKRLSDDRSIQIWNMTNQEHYKTLKAELIQDTISDEEDNTEYFDDDEYIDEEDIDKTFDFEDGELPDDENEISEPIKEESVIPIEGGEAESSKFSKTDICINRDNEKDTQADQYEIDSNINIIGTVTGKNEKEYLDNLEKSFKRWNSQNQDHRKKSDDKCREIYGMSNIDRYKKLKGDILKIFPQQNPEEVIKPPELLGEFVSEVYNNMKVINETESYKSKQHRRLNDTPYFTPSELIDMGVHGNDNYYCPQADNDGLITNIKIPTWFDSYKDMCMDHIFEDYRKDWIDTMNFLYSDFEQIKASGDEEKILSRKQSILDLGWNPEIPFTIENRKKASKRVSSLLDITTPKDIFITLPNVDNIEEDNTIEEAVNKRTHKPVLLIFTQGKTPVISQGIKFVTGSSYSHASISFDPELNEVYSYNMRKENFGFIRENLSSFKDNIISVMAFFAPNNIVKVLKDKVEDFENNKTFFDLRIFLNKILHIDHKVSKNEYNQVCSTFVDSVLRSGGINLTGDINIPDPGQLYNATKSEPNKIIEVYNGLATNYNGKSIKKSLNLLYNQHIDALIESVMDANAHEKNDIFHNIDMWENGESNILFVTGLSGSGKSTISKELSNTYNTEYVELDNLLRAKMNNWDTTKCKMLDDYIKSVGGLDNIFPYCNELNKQISWKDIVCEEDKCKKEFIRCFDFIMNYSKTHRNKKFIVEGIQIFYYADNETIKLLSNYPIILKMNGPLKTEYRREKRSIKYGIDNDKSFIDIFTHVAGHVKNWIKDKFYIDDYNSLKNFKKTIGESVMNESVLNEIKQFPVEFDKEGNLIIYKSRIGSLSYGDEIADSVQLLESYRNTNNIEGMKYELAKLWFINDSIEKKLKKHLTNQQYKDLIDDRATCLNTFKFNLEYVMKAEQGFNFSDYYNSTPFSDNSIKITSDTLKYTIKAVSKI